MMIDMFMHFFGLLTGLVSSIGAVGAVFVSLSNRKIVAEIKLSVNGRLDPLLKYAADRAAEKVIATADETARKLKSPDY